MKTPEMDQATAPLVEHAQDVTDEPVISTIDGKPIAALISIKSADLETVTLLNMHFEK